MTLMRKASLSLCAAVVSTLAVTAQAQAQTWTPMPATPRNVVAVTAEWPSGVQMVARCTRGRDLDVFMTLGQAVAQPHVAVTVTEGDAGPSEQLWRLSEDGLALFVRRPTHLLRSLLHHQDVVVEVEPDEAPRHRYALSAPSGPESLTRVLAACRRPTSPPWDDVMNATNPEWLRRPTAADLTRLYPDQAAQDRIPGEAVLECRVSAQGRLEDCIIVSESPEGMGFGAATVALASSFRMTPPRANGHSHVEALIRMPFSWRMP